METDILTHPRIHQTIAALVADQGGSVRYEQGCGGRETLVAAGLHLATATGEPLTIVEAAVLRTEVAAFARAVRPDLAHTFLAAGALEPREAIRAGGVLAVHADVLRDETVRAAVHDLAHAARHLIVAQHTHRPRDSVLEAIAGSVHTLTAAGLMATTPVTPAPVAARTAEAGIRLAARIYALDQDIASTRTVTDARALRLRREGMLDALRTVLEVHHDTSMIFPPLAEEVVAQEGRRRFDHQRAAGRPPHRPATTTAASRPPDRPGPPAERPGRPDPGRADADTPEQETSGPTTERQTADDAAQPAAPADAAGPWHDADTAEPDRRIAEPRARRQARPARQADPLPGPHDPHRASQPHPQHPGRHGIGPR